eukprot:COSAG01_NODE_5675_length_4107_cov_2.978293_4_plen_98_part_00
MDCNRRPRLWPREYDNENTQPSLSRSNPFDPLSRNLTRCHPQTLVERDNGSDWLGACCRCMRASVQIQMKGARLPEKLHGLSVLTRAGNSCAQIDTA